MDKHNNSDIFQITIELGNEAMQSPHDVATALREMVRQLYNCDPKDTSWNFNRRIHDLNGNTVGFAEVIR